ncbi:cytochrome P450 [Falsiroseomonas bella]|uniref:Cytochrome P450 n=1 Tax=Falsiroseomonas bella TaxID=2184016 RepID=A0A317FHF9_9PROT|nr:cytochrome P450 [Falsiroseomonas bella]PWS37068.1 cytochrome P450 [Falsiroseomonas bella]
MSSFPRDPAFDSTFALLREGYRFIPARCERLDTDVFETRLMLRRAICMRGEEAARMFYAPDRFTRRGALPQTTLRLLQDKGSVATLDGAAHRRRKAMFMSLMGAESLAALEAAAEDAWQARIATWPARQDVVLLDEAHAVFCRAACRWAGIPLPEAETPARTRELAAMIAGAGAFGPSVLKALRLRRRTERWASGLVRQVRRGALQAPEGSALRVFAEHRDAEGQLLPPGTVAVELINILRPTVAVARFVVFAALALHREPAWRRRLAAAPTSAELEAFVQEVRRFHPFFPMVAGRVRAAFDWRGHHFRDGDWVLLDLYGTDHDPRIWGDPEVFRPERFHDWDGSPFNFVPQGGGEHFTGHRCPGEWATIALMRGAVRLLARLPWDMPEQDLTVDLSRMPAQPRSGVILRLAPPG